MTVARTIKELRKEKKISQKKLAIETKIGQSTISELEKGKYEPTASTIRILAAYFEVTTDYLLGLEHETGAKYVNSFNNANINASNKGNIKF